MNNNSLSEHQDFLLERMAGEHDFVGWALVNYQRIEQVDRQQMRDMLHLANDEAFLRLALCKMPNPDAPDFAARVQSLVDFAGADFSALMRIIRQVTNVQRLAALQDFRLDSPLLKAARVSDNPDHISSDDSNISPKLP